MKKPKKPKPKYGLNVTITQDILVREKDGTFKPTEYFDSFMTEIKRADEQIVYEKT